MWTARDDVEEPHALVDAATAVAKNHVRRSFMP
jgi:hypothetical protein